MASNLKNLSDVGSSVLKNIGKVKIAVVFAEWNANITDNLHAGCVEHLLSQGIKAKNIHSKKVPGSFELPSAAAFLALTAKYDAIVCLGSVIRGETSHFDYVCSAVAHGIKDVAIKFNIPVIFGVLTDDNLQQAIDRSGGKHGNKGVEAAATALKMIAFKQDL